jgi:hypothetical protein
MIEVNCYKDHDMWRAETRVGDKKVTEVARTEHNALSLLVHRLSCWENAYRTVKEEVQAEITRRAVRCEVGI